MHFDPLQRIMFSCGTVSAVFAPLIPMTGHNRPSAPFSVMIMLGT